MKKSFVVILAALFFAPLVKGQSNAEEIEFFQSIFGSEKKAIVSAFISPEGEAGDAFWTLYDAYETERKVLGKNRIAMMEKYVESYEGMSDEVIDETITSMNKQKKALDKLIDSYYKKIKKASGSKTAAQFYQLEQYFLAAIRLSVLETMPVIGQLSD